MKFAKLLKENREEITKLWLKKTLGTYPKDSREFLESQTDQFANPVGNTHATALKKLVDLLVDKVDLQEMRTALTDVIKIRSVQDFSHISAVSFVILLKDIVRDVLKKDLQALSSAAKDLTQFDASVDRMLLEAFSVYSDLREQLYKIRIDEVKRNVATLIKRTGFFDEDQG